MPPAIGRPHANPQSLGLRLIATGAAVGVANSLAASGILLFGAGLFVTDAETVAAVSTLVPYVAAALFIHCCSMATEGIMLAGRRYYYLVITLLFNCAVAVPFSLGASMGSLGLEKLYAVWVGIITFQSVRLAINVVALLSPWSVLKSNTPLNSTTTNET